MKRQHSIRINALIVLDTKEHEYFALMHDQLFSGRCFFSVMKYDGSHELRAQDQCQTFVNQNTAIVSDARFITSLLTWLNFGSYRMSANERIKHFNDSFSPPD